MDFSPAIFWEANEVVDVSNSPCPSSPHGGPVGTQSASHSPFTPPFPEKLAQSGPSLNGAVITLQSHHVTSLLQLPGDPTVSRTKSRLFRAALEGPYDSLLTFLSSASLPASPCTVPPSPVFLPLHIPSSRWEDSPLVYSLVGTQ